MIAVRSEEFIYIWPDGVYVTKETDRGMVDWRAEGPDGAPASPLLVLRLAEFKQFSLRTPLLKVRLTVERRPVTRRAMKQAKGRRGKAAGVLQVPERSLYRLLKELGLEDVK